MKFSKMIKMMLTTIAIAGTFTLAYAGDSDIYGDVSQTITLEEVDLDSTSGEAKALLGSVSAFDNSYINSDVVVELTTKSINVTTANGHAHLKLGGIQAGQTSN